MAKQSAHVRAIQTLSDLKSALSRFAGNTRCALRSADSEIQHTQNWLREREAHWRRVVAERRREVEKARQAYEACMRRGHSRSSRNDEGRSSNCSAQAAALRRAEAALREAQAKLDTVKYWQVQVRQAVDRYRVHARRLQELTTTRTEIAKTFLERKRADLEKYQRAMVASAFIAAASVVSRRLTTRARQRAVRLAKKQEIALAQKTGQGTRPWNKQQLRQLRRGQFPKTYHGHHINNVRRFPARTGNPDNIEFVTQKEHYQRHQGNWHNNTSGKMYNRKSLMIQWGRYK
jgi:hypothetical protein